MLLTLCISTPDQIKYFKIKNLNLADLILYEKYKHFLKMGQVIIFCFGIVVDNEYASFIYMPWDYEVWPSQSLTPFMLDLIEQT